VVTRQAAQHGLDLTARRLMSAAGQPWALGRSGGVSADRWGRYGRSPSRSASSSRFGCAPLWSAPSATCSTSSREAWLSYRRYALGLNLFWTALTFADPLAALLLIYRRRAGVYVALSIISIDVAVNSAVGVGEFVKSGHFTFWGLYTQVPVGVFMWTTAPMLWRSDGRNLALDTHEA